MIKMILNTDKLAGAFLILYGAASAVMIESPEFNLVGLLSYYLGAYQMCIAPFENYTDL